ncbi:MAG: hypothetical protein ACI80V_001295 [Rhodothermales bacterium]|jgi:hypothetical protein
MVGAQRPARTLDSALLRTSEVFPQPESPVNITLEGALPETEGGRYEASFSTEAAEPDPSPAPATDFARCGRSP